MKHAKLTGRRRVGIRLCLGLLSICAARHAAAGAAAQDGPRAAWKGGPIAAPKSTAAFSIPNLGGVSMTTSGSAEALSTGYAKIQVAPLPGNTTPSGVAIFGFRQGNTLVSEAGVPASPLMSAGRIYAEVSGPVNTGLAIANPGAQRATVTFYFTDQNGANFGTGTLTIEAGGQTAAFLSQAPFNAGTLAGGTFTFSSDVPIAAIALRGLTNERSEFLITTLPVTPLALAAGDTQYFPHFADGGGWTTQILLVNPTDDTMSGSVQFFGQGSDTSAAQPVTITIGGQTASSFSYTIPGRSSRRLQTAGSAAGALVGSVRLVPSANGKAPAGLAVFSFRKGGVTVSEAGVSASRPGRAFRLYSEASDPASAWIGTGIAIANPSNTKVRANFELIELNGEYTGLNGSVMLPANGQTALFLSQIQGFASLPTPFKGILRISTDSPAGISVVGLRGRDNERGDFLVTTTPPSDEAVAGDTSTRMFPHFADGSGYTTQFVLFSGSPYQSSFGSLQFFSRTGENSNLTLNPDPPVPQPLAIFPSPASAPPGQTVRFSGLVNGAASDTFNWSIAEGTDGGSITEAGLYTAPRRMGLYHVVATSRTDPGKSATALVNVTDIVQTDRSITLDFTQTRFSYTLAVDFALSASPVVIFRATNKGPNELPIHLQTVTCNGYTTTRPIMQNGHIPTSSGDVVFFKVALEYGWCKGTQSGGGHPIGDYPVGSTEIQKVDFFFRLGDPTPQQPATELTVPIRVAVSRPTETDLPPGETHVEVLLRDASGRATAGEAQLATEFGWRREFSDANGKVTFNVAKAMGYWLWSNSGGRQSKMLYVDGNNVQPEYRLTLTQQRRWDVSAQLLATVKGRIGFWKASVNRDKTKILMVNGMENWSDPSLVGQSKLYLLDVQSGAVLWTHSLGNHSWASDLSDDARYAVVATHSMMPTLPTVQPSDVYVRLLDARDGSAIWTKQMFSSEFPSECTSYSSFGSHGVKFSHDASYVFVGFDTCPYAYLLNRSDGSIRWRIGNASGAREAIFSSDDRFIYIAPGDGWARKLNTADGSEAWRQFVGGFAFTNGLNITADEKHLCTQTKSGDLTLLKTADGSIVLQKRYGGWAGSCTFSPDGKILLGSSGGSGSDAFDVETGRQLWYRWDLTGYPPPQMDSKGVWIVASPANQSGIFDAQGNLIQQFEARDPRTYGVSHVGWLSPDETRYIFATRDVNAPSGDVDVIQIYRIKVIPPP